MKRLLVSVVSVLLFAGPASAQGPASEAVVCSVDSYAPYIAVAAWSADEPVGLSVLALSEPLSTARTIPLPSAPKAPATIRCEPSSLLVWSADSAYRVRAPASRSPDVERPTEGQEAPASNDFVHLACRNGELVREHLQDPLGRYKQQPLDHSRHFDRYSFGVRREGSDATGDRRWRLVVDESQRRGTPSGRLAPAHVSREVTILELVCLRDEGGGRARASSDPE